MTARANSFITGFDALMRQAVPDVHSMMNSMQGEKGRTATARGTRWLVRPSMWTGLARPARITEACHDTGGSIAGEGPGNSAAYA